MDHSYRLNRSQTMRIMALPIMCRLETFECHDCQSWSLLVMGGVIDSNSGFPLSSSLSIGELTRLWWLEHHQCPFIRSLTLKPPRNLSWIRNGYVSLRAANSRWLTLRVFWSALRMDGIPAWWTASKSSVQMSLPVISLFLVSLSLSPSPSPPSCHSLPPMVALRCCWSRLRELQIEAQEA